MCSMFMTQQLCIISPEAGFIKATRAQFGAYKWKETSVQNTCIRVS